MTNCLPSVTKKFVGVVSSEHAGQKIMKSFKNYFFFNLIIDDVVICVCSRILFVCSLAIYIFRPRLACLS